MLDRFPIYTCYGAGHSAGPYRVSTLANWPILAKCPKADAAQG